MIIVEGPDGAGKSTLCDMLLDGGIITKLVQSPGRTRGKVPLLEQTLRYMRLYRKDHNTAVDRFMWSELVYGPILRDKCKFSNSNYMAALQELMYTGCIIIFCLPGIENLKFKSDENSQVIVNADRIYHSYEAHFARVSNTYAKALKYNWTQPEAYHHLIEQIIYHRSKK